METIFDSLMAKAAERWQHAGCTSDTKIFDGNTVRLQQAPACNLCWLEALVKQVCAEALRPPAFNKKAAEIMTLATDMSFYEEEIDGDEDWNEMWSIVKRDIIGGGE